ncbi:single-stranded-DNA-specific exonuclease RecJ [Roseiflexus sp.]|uniref:single-stranded-DNA-specific exonuclease RecJ n=1 Tax=Roseiflexus sp. TaxID=2562120 RepID=UPI00398B4F9B
MSRLSARNKRWLINKTPREFIAAFRQFPPLIAAVLYQRDLRSEGAIREFFASDYRLHDPFSLRGMETAVQRIVAAIQNHEPMAVYGDYDTDGVTAVTLLVQVIRAMGGMIQPYVPHRIREGYGLNIAAIDALAREGVRLLITVDCGISNVREAEHARAVGLDLIITDHHAPPARLPNALAIINPKQPGCLYPFKHLVGVGIAYQLARALARRGLRSTLQKDDLLDVVAIGTVTDMGPLIGENRVLVTHGLKALNAAQRPGVRALIEAAGLTPGRVTSTDISFGLGPRLNASGRIDNARLSYELLLAEELETAQRLAHELNMQNRQRQELSKSVQAQASEQIRALGKDRQRIIVLDDVGYPAGVVGLVAARLVEEYGRPTVLIERGETWSRGSARSIPGFSIIEALTACADLFERFGGHTEAAGFTIATDRLPELEERLVQYAEECLPDDLLTPSLWLDAEISLGELSYELLKELMHLEPFGQGNPQPVLMSSRVQVIGAWPRGSEGQHLKLRLADASGAGPVDAIAFRFGHLARYFEQPRWIDVAYTLQADEWNGGNAVQLNVKDFRSAR